MSDQNTEFPILDFDLDEIDVREERSKYPFDQLKVGQGFQVRKKGSSVSGRVSAQNRKGSEVYVTRIDKNSTPENPITNVIRIK